MTENLFERNDNIDEIHISRGELCRLLEYSPSYVSMLVTKGVVAEGPRGINLVRAVRGIVEWQRNIIERRGSQDVQAERVLLIRAQRELAELQLARERGRLVDKEHTLSGWSQILALIRARLLPLPSKLAPVGFGKRTMAELEEVIRTGIHEALSDLSGDDRGR